MSERPNGLPCVQGLRLRSTREQTMKITPTARHLDAARAEARTSLRLHPSVEAFLVLARLDLRDNNIQAAGENVDRALALEPHLPEALLAQGRIAYALKRFDDGIRLVQQAIERKPNCDGAYYVLCRAFIASGRAS